MALSKHKESRKYTSHSFHSNDQAGVFRDVVTPMRFRLLEHLFLPAIRLSLALIVMFLSASSNCEKELKIFEWSRD